MTRSHVPRDKPKEVQRNVCLDERQLETPNPWLGDCGCTRGNSTGSCSFFHNGRYGPCPSGHACSTVCNPYTLSYPIHKCPQLWHGCALSPSFMSRRLGPQGPSVGEGCKSQGVTDLGSVLSFHDGCWGSNSACQAHTAFAQRATSLARYTSPWLAWNPLCKEPLGHTGGSALRRD